MRAPAKRSAEKDDYEDDYDDYSEPTMRLSQAFIVVLILHVVAVGGVFAFNMMKTRHAAAAAAAASSAVKAEATPAPGSAPGEAVASSTPVPKATPVPRPANGIHEVQAGDTLTRIAGLYGVSIAAIEAENGLASESHIRPGQRLRIPVEGAARTTPAASTPPRAAASPAPRTEPVARATPAPSAAPVAKATPAAAKPPAQADAPDVYEVVKGDNPYSIAKKFKVSYTELLKVNGITDPTKLQIGQKLSIPKKN